jgi:hypothetical protein
MVKLDGNLGTLFVAKTRSAIALLRLTREERKSGLAKEKKYDKHRSKHIVKHRGQRSFDSRKACANMYL